MGLLMLPLRVVGQSLCSLLSSQWISEDVLCVGFPQALPMVFRPCAGLCRLCCTFCWSGVCTENHFYCMCQYVKHVLPSLNKRLSCLSLSFYALQNWQLSSFFYSFTSSHSQTTMNAFLLYQNIVWACADQESQRTLVPTGLKLSE